MASHHHPIPSLHSINRTVVISKNKTPPAFFSPFTRSRASPSFQISSSFNLEGGGKNQEVDISRKKASDVDSSFAFPSNSSESNLESEARGKELAVKLAFAKAKAYKESKQTNPGPGIADFEGSHDYANASSSDSQDINSESELRREDLAAKLDFARARAFEDSKLSVPNPRIADSEDDVGIAKGLSEGIEGIHGGWNVKKNVNKKEIKVSRFDFMGLDFSDKKSSKGLPAGLVPMADPFPKGDLPEVELIVGDPSKFQTPSVPGHVQEDAEDLYRPKVSTWGVFPRPQNISKTFGGGRVICPGEVLETAKTKSIKEACTKQVLTAYKKKIGLNVDPELKYECEKALKDGDSLMDLGKLRDALPYYEQVLTKLAFQNELHGLAALRWSICQDSLNRSDTARGMYNRLLSHPNHALRKKAKHYLFGFEAMEKMKVQSLSACPETTGYQNFFEEFVEDKMSPSTMGGQAEGDAVAQIIPYVIFLVSPIAVMLLLVVKRATCF